MTGRKSVPAGTVLREACWHSAPTATRKGVGCRDEAHAYARMATPGAEAGLPRHYLDRLSTGAKLKRPAGESKRTGMVLFLTSHGWRCSPCARMTMIERAPWADCFTRFVHVMMAVES